MQPFGVTVQSVYHSLHPHPALSPVPLTSNPQAIEDQALNETVWRQLLLQGILALLLPPEDLNNSCLRVLVTEIFSEMIVGNGLSAKACEGWMIWDGLTKAIEAMRNRKDLVIEKVESPTASRLEQFGLLPIPGQAASTISSKHGKVAGSLLQIFVQTLLILNVAFIMLRNMIVAFSNSSSLPTRSSISKHSTLASNRVSAPSSRATSPSIGFASNDEPKRAILDMPAWSLPARILSLDIRMPWLTGFLPFLQYHVTHRALLVGCTDGRIDRSVKFHFYPFIRSPCFRCCFLLLDAQLCVGCILDKSTASATQLVV